MRKILENIICIGVVVLLSVFIYQSCVFTFINWYLHLLDFMHNDILELSILCAITGVVEVLVYFVGYRLEQKNCR